MQLIVISNGATGISYLKAFLCGSCLFTGVGGQFIPSRGSSQSLPLLAVLAQAKSCRATPAPPDEQHVDEPCFWLLQSSFEFPSFAIQQTHIPLKRYSCPTLSASGNHRGSRQQPSPWNWGWEVNKRLVLPYKSEFVRKDNVGWPALLKKRCGDILQEKAPMNHLGTNVMTIQTR